MLQKSKEELIINNGNLNEASTTIGLRKKIISFVIKPGFLLCKKKDLKMRVIRNFSVCNVSAMQCANQLSQSPWYKNGINIKFPFMFMVYIYKYLVSPILPSTCRFLPSCSEYALQALLKRSIFIACMLTLKRILKCNPFFKGGHDPV